jgi:hypothetical protein
VVEDEMEEELHVEQRVLWMAKELEVEGLEVEGLEVVVVERPK